MVNVCCGPVQETPLCVNVGVTTIVDTNGAAVLFVAVKEEILPFPDAPRPMAVLLFVQEYVVFPTVLTVLNVVEPITSVLQTSTDATLFTCAVGLTVATKEVVVPKQVVPLSTYCGTTLIVELIGSVPELVALKAEKSKTLFALLAIPVFKLLLFQL